MILSGIIEGILLAAFLTLFDCDEGIKKSFKELFDKDISQTTYYFIFAILGIIANIIEELL